MSHGVAYGWLTALLPSVATVESGDSDDLYFTDEGLAELSPLTDGDINAGPWHNHFEGDLGGLKVLVRSEYVQDITGADAAVIIGGAQVSIDEEPAPEAEPTEEPNCIPGIPGFSCGGEPGGGVSNRTAVPQATAAAQPTQPAAPAPPAPTVRAVTQPNSDVLGAIRAPDTGTGPGGSDHSRMLMLVVVTFIVATGTVATGIARRR